MIRTFSELNDLETFEERYSYLALRGNVGASTFGFDRHMNQRFYTSRQWRQLRDEVIVRDGGCDLGVDGYEIHERILIHHMNPMTAEDLVHGNEEVLDPEFLISTTHQTHNAIHYGDARQLARPLTVRRPGDTQLWTPIRKETA